MVDKMVKASHSQGSSQQHCTPLFLSHCQNCHDTSQVTRLTTETQWISMLKICAVNTSMHCHKNINSSISGQGRFIFLLRNSSVNKDFRSHFKTTTQDIVDTSETIYKQTSCYINGWQSIWQKVRRYSLCEFTFKITEASTKFL